MKNKKWSEYLWLVTIPYFVLGYFNIMFAWIGMIFFMTPLAFAIFKGNKTYCHNYCERGQFYTVVGKKLSRNKPMPKFMTTSAFRYGFLTFFMVMFANMIFTTYLVFSSAQDLKEVVTLFWTFKLPWNYVVTSDIPTWVVQYAFGFYSMMLTSASLGFITMILYKPRSFCVYCPMGTMTQTICKIKSK